MEGMGGLGSSASWLWAIAAELMVLHFQSNDWEII